MSGPGDRILTFSDLDSPFSLRNARADCEAMLQCAKYQLIEIVIANPECSV